MAGIRRTYPGESFRGAVHRIEHHLAHLGSAFMVSPEVQGIIKTFGVETAQKTYFVRFESPVSGLMNGAEVEKMYLDLVRDVKQSVKIPVAVKLGHFFSSIPSFVKKLDDAGADGVVLFNRFYQPDLDLENLEVVPNLSLSSSYELRLRLRWAAILYGNIQADMALTGGVHTAEDAIKSMMVGAKAAQMASVLLHYGVHTLSDILVDMQRWMETHEYTSVKQMQGSMSQRKVGNPAAFERANYMKVLQSYQVQVV